MHTITPERARQLALTHVRPFNNHGDPMTTLFNYPWEVPVDIFPTQAEFSEWNISLDPRGCLGRMAISAVVAETLAPSKEILAGEVLSDYLRGCMLIQFEDNAPDDPQTHEAWLRELLMYEEPHAVIIFDGSQFDSASQKVKHLIQHPRIQQFPVWNFVASAMLVAHAILETDLDTKAAYLNEAEKTCPDTQLVKENIIALHLLRGRKDRALDLMDATLKTRPTALGFYVRWLTSQHREHKSAIDLAYPPGMFDFLERHYGAALKGGVS